MCPGGPGGVLRRGLGELLRVAGASAPGAAGPLRTAGAVLPPASRRLAGIQETFQAPAQGGRAPATLSTSRSLAARAFSQGATPAPGADIRAHSSAASASTSSSPSKYKAPKLCRQPLAVLMEMSCRWQCSLVTSKSILYGATSLSPRVKRYRPRNASTMAASLSCRSQSSASFCVARTNESPAGTLSVSTELSCAWRSHQARVGAKAASSSPRRGMAAEPRCPAWRPQ